MELRVRIGERLEYETSLGKTGSGTVLEVAEITGFIKLRNQLGIETWVDVEDIYLKDEDEDEQNNNG
ncbi:hypothetical protein I8751_14715 [Nostocaceae cyanobacterium CENA357]|uniref:Uncharacterized protein n=1 Tax=Atlanticothrix silvestris CENA357 TaxID=1725252 RepID=A0A8J7HJK7_9CYAN|nr:hypothetical protein [Atlanticothrix silvestris]MBH8553600.1 hypothetical protein [Atlanticothrix silvestris CENA357]